MSLASLVSRERWTEFEDAWTDLMLQGGPLEGVYAAIRLAADKKQLQRCVPLAREHAELLRGSGKSAEAAHLLGTAMLAGGNPGELAGPLFEAATEAWSSETWWEPYSEVAGMQAGVQDMRSAWLAFRRCMSLVPGAAVYHAKGWGIGLVEGVEGVEIEVRFRTGRRDRFPLTTAIEIFEILAREDFRSLVVTDPDELKRLVREEPLEVLKNVLERFRGRAGYAVIKGALSQLNVDGTSFGGWWRKARKQAEASAWFEVTGTSTKAQVQLLATAADPAESMRRSLSMIGDLQKANTRVRDLLSGGHVDVSVRDAALETLEELAADEYAQEGARLGAWMLLREQRAETPEPLRQRMVAAAYIEAPEDPSQAPELWVLFGRLANSRDQERCIGLLAELFPDADDRRTQILRHLQHAAPGMVRGLVSELMEGGCRAELSEHYNLLLHRPTRNPGLLAALADHAENGRLEGDWPIPAHRVQSMMRLAVHLEQNRIGNTALARAQQRLTGVLTGGKPSVLRRLLAGSDASVLRSTLNIAERGVDSPLENELIALIAETAPELFRDQDKPFWEAGIWTTREGLRRRQAELKHLVDVKLPDNSEAIGKAAAFGDLSENSEWEAAIEEQRNLTTRAQDIEAELRSAHLIEEASLPGDTVAPGTRVRYRELASREEIVVSLLGPWDTGEDVISYRAPVAAGLLGGCAGGRATLSLPLGEIEVEILSIETLAL